MSNTNSIPEPTPDLQGLITTVRALKEVVEGLTGQRPGRVAPAPRIYVRPVRPDPREEPVNPYDLWIASGTNQMHYFDGRLWQRLQP